MAGHSKWKKIQRKKGAADAKRGKIFTQLIREITICARKGGGDIDFNPALRAAVIAARQANMPSDNIERAIKRGTGELEGVSFEQVSYEAYGPGGVAMIVDVITDNKNRIVSELRNCFTRYNGNLATTGSVAWMFTKKGIITVDKKDSTEEKLLELALNAGADDMKDEGEYFEIQASFENFEGVRKAIEYSHVKISSADLSMAPQSTVHLHGKEAQQMINLVEALEAFDDVQKVHANFDIDEQELEKLAS